MVVGADQKFPAALIVPAFHLVKEWCKNKNIAAATHDDMIRNEKVLEEFKNIVEDYNKNFNHVEQIKKFELLPQEWSIEGGELTPTLKLKRKIIMEKYRKAVERIYA